MSDIIIRVLNVFGRPLVDRMDAEVISQRTQGRIAHLQDVAASRGVRVTGLDPGEAYVIRVFPVRHRPVGRVTFAPPSGEKRVEMVCPIHPDRVTRVDYADFAGVDTELRRVLTASSGVEGFEGITGADLYGDLNDLPKAGMLNLFAKMDRTRFEDGTSVSSYFESLYRVRGDRVFGDVRKELRDKVKTAAAAGAFEDVPEALHTPPMGFHSAGSFKTEDDFGNLQLSFFASDDGPIRFKVDADIDDANGIRHVFQVLRNWIGDRATHPYDIHEILVGKQKIVPAYLLVP